MKDSYYFSHDSNAKDDPKCIMLIEQLGLEGYGIYWILIETLRDQSNYSYPLNLLPALARRFNTTHEKIKAVVHSYNLFEITGDDFFYSNSLLERMELYDNKRDMQRQRVLKRYYPTTVEPQYNDGIQSKVKESKVKESKVNYITLNHQIDEIYNLYPGKCPIASRPTGKSTKDKTRIKNMLEEKGFDNLKNIIEQYVKQCFESKCYIKNFATFLNNLPDMEAIDKTTCIPLKTDQEKFEDDLKLRHPEYFIDK